METALAPWPFRKMHGLGNDFVIVDRRAGGAALPEPVVRAMGDRHRGIGFDQLAEIVPGTDGAVADLVFWNADGSLSGACGNATRCVADLLMAEQGGTALSLRTERGLLACRRAGDGRVTVDMLAPLTDWRDVPLAQATNTASLPLDGAPAACSMGNPHCTFFVDDTAAVDLPGLGTAIEHHPLFPKRTNVQFVQVLARDHARVRVWERGVGVTLASGSSSCAVVVNAARRGLMDRHAVLDLDGGQIEILWREDGHVEMTGPVSYAFDGHWAPRTIP